MEKLENIIIAIGDNISNYILIPLLIVIALFMTWKTGGVQFRMVPDMVRQLFAAKSGPDKQGSDSVSSFQAFMVSIASRVGTGNLAGVATAISLGGPGAVFWMWIIALLGASSAFVESTLAQIFKVKDGKGGFRGGPAYYIKRGIGVGWWAILFAILISVTFGFAYNSVQSNTIAEAFYSSWGIDRWITAIAVTSLTLFIIWGGIRSIARFSEWVVPIMAVAYLIIGLFILVMNFDRIPLVLAQIFENAFGINQALGGTVGTAMVMGIRRGLFSNEAGEGSAPNVAATADVSHPVKQGLVQALGVYTDTLLICTCTALIILLSGVEIRGAEGITLTQRAIDSQSGLAGFGATFVSLAIFFFAFTSIVANYYYGETNIRFMTGNGMWINFYRIAVGLMVMIGAVSSLGLVWAFADITMALMAICNLIAICVLVKYVVRALNDYKTQRKERKNPIYYRDVNPEIEHITDCWPEKEE